MSIASSYLAQSWPVTTGCAGDSIPSCRAPRHMPPSRASAWLRGLPSSDAAQRADSGGSSDGHVHGRDVADSSHVTYPLACDGGQSCSSLRGLAAAQLDHEREAA